MTAPRKEFEALSPLAQTRPIESPRSGVRACDDDVADAFASASEVRIPRDEHVTTAWFKLDAILGDKLLALQSKLLNASVSRAARVGELVDLLAPVRDALALLHANVLDGLLAEDTMTMLWYSCVGSIYDWALRVLDHSAATFDAADADLATHHARLEALRESSLFIPPLMQSALGTWGRHTPTMRLLYARIVYLNTHWNDGALR